MQIVSVLVVFASPLVSAFGSLPALNPGRLANTTTGLCSTEVPTFDLTEVQKAANAVSTASNVTEACEQATILVEAEFEMVPTTQLDSAGNEVNPPVGCLEDVLRQEGMCALVSQQMIALFQNGPCLPFVDRFLKALTPFGGLREAMTLIGQLCVS